MYFCLTQNEYQYQIYSNYLILSRGKEGQTSLRFEYNLRRNSKASKYAIPPTVLTTKLMLCTIAPLCVPQRRSGAGIDLCKTLDSSMSKPEILRCDAIVDHMIYQNSDEPAKVAAYQWLLGVFDGPSEPVVDDDGMMQLL
jgi:hypothetical protein